MKSVARLLSLMLLTIWLPARLCGQNMVPNGDFEQHYTCPVAYANAADCIGWHMYHLGTSDYYHTCNTYTILRPSAPQNFIGYQAPHSGNAYMGLATYVKNKDYNYKEYITRTITPLLIDAPYEVSMSVSLADSSIAGTDDLGVWFFSQAPKYNGKQVLPVTPQVSFKKYGAITDKVNWLRLSGTFITDSVYDNIVIGGFTDYAHVGVEGVAGGTMDIHNQIAYYYIDSVSVKLIEGFYFQFHDTFCPGEDFYVKYYAYRYTFQAGNVITMQLSDEHGSFAQAHDIGSIAATTAGYIKGTLPANLAAGTYKIRLIADMPADTAAGEGIVVINPKAGLTTWSNSPVCKWQDLELHCRANAATSFNWWGPGEFTSNLQDPVINKAGTDAQGAYRVVAKPDKGYCTDTAYINAEISPIPEDLAVHTNSPVCHGDTLQLQASSSSAGVTYRWQGPDAFYAEGDAVSDTRPIPHAANSYLLWATLGRCTIQLETPVAIRPVPKVELGNNAMLCNNEVQTLAPGLPDVTYTWQDGSTLPYYTIKGKGQYWVKVHSDACGDYSDTMYADYQLCDCRPIVPSAFTPNGDGLNDRVGPLIDCVYNSVDFMIVNRFGAVVFRSADATQKWDGTFNGTTADIGTYVYLLKIHGIENRSFLFKGDITLIR